MSRYRGQTGGLVVVQDDDTVTIQWERGEEVFVYRFEDERQLIGHRTEVGQSLEWRETVFAISVIDLIPTRITLGWSVARERERFERARQRWLAAA